MELMGRVYSLAAELPPDERFELCRQLRRAAVSVPANIAEGTGRATDLDFARFLLDPRECESAQGQGPGRTTHAFRLHEAAPHQIPAFRRIADSEEGGQPQRGR